MGSVFSDARRGHVGLFGFAAVMLVAVPVLAVLAVLDDRTLLGAPVWLKPFKFSVSFAAYAGALAWMLGRLRRPAGSTAGWVIVVASTAEMAIIAVQAGRGVPSHFNADGGVGTLLYSVMGATILVLYVATVVVAVQVVRRADRDDRVALAVRVGLAITILGLSAGFALVANDGHSVGVAEGGAGLFLTGWSTTGGDLRVAHFVGMHALQVFPVLALVISSRWGARLDHLQFRRVVLATGAGYAALVVLLEVQALRAEPLLEPSAPTSAVLVSILALTAAAVTLSVTRGRQRAQV